ncbi:MAG TPA: phosphoglucosamine mutase [Rhodanobacteraceae bacterium]|nr:phosphoglucosamine mutase [Rhodanobacteraceae bacterium]
MEKKYFGTDGIRGKVGNWPITAEFMLRLGRAAGVALANGEGRATVLIGKDTRVSGYMFESALEAGLVAAGANVLLVGPMPTPAVAMLTRSLRADAGIVISASHNPHYDNGIKFFSADGEKLDDEVEAAIEREVDAEFVTVPSHELGKATRVDDANTRYVEFCKSTLPEDFSLRGLKLVLDCAHGATYQVAPKVFRELSAEVVTIGAAPDGFNINDDVGSMHPEGMQKAVVEHRADAGICFDGDGDRVLMADAAGRLVDGDDLLYILARGWHARGSLHGPVVGTVMSNYGLEQALEALDVPLIRAKVGDRYVLKQLKARDGNLGGETSGHILCLDRATTGDGIVSALAVLEMLVGRGESMAEALASLDKLPQITINVRVDDGAECVASQSVQEALAQVRQELEGRGRVVLRPSGTEPVVRVTVEAADADEVGNVAKRLADVVKSGHSRS